MLRTVPSAQESVLSTLEKSQGQIFIFAPHHLLVQKVQTSSITQNNGRVCPPPPTRITTPYTFGVCQQVNKQKHCTVNAPEHYPEGKFSVGGQTIIEWGFCNTLLWICDRSLNGVIIITRKKFNTEKIQCLLCWSECDNQEKRWTLTLLVNGGVGWEYDISHRRIQFLRLRFLTLLRLYFISHCSKSERRSTLECVKCLKSSPLPSTCKR